MKLRVLLTASIILIAVLLFQNAACLRRQIAPDEVRVPSPCMECHESIREITGESHVEIGKGDIQYCKTCHGAPEGELPLAHIIHLAHLSSDGFSGDCSSCHHPEKNKLKFKKDEIEKLSSFFYSWAGSQNLDHFHAEAGIDCLGCHKTWSPDNGLSLEECLNCHGSYEEVAERTKRVKPNPHESHYVDLRCTLCHKAHNDSVLYCNTCHEFDLKTP